MYIIVLALIISLLTFITVNEIKEKDKSSSEIYAKEVELSIIDQNHELLKNLVFPTFNKTSVTYPKSENRTYLADVPWIFETISKKDLSRKDMMFSVQKLSKYTDMDTDYASIYVYSETEIKNNFKKIFSPDTKYKSETVYKTPMFILEDNKIKVPEPDGHYCGLISYYDKDKKAYYANHDCGGDYYPEIEFFTKINKVTKDDKKIEAYYYFAYIFENLIFKDYPN